MWIKDQNNNGEQREKSQTDEKKRHERTRQRERENKWKHVRKTSKRGVKLENIVREEKKKIELILKVEEEKMTSQDKQWNFCRTEDKTRITNDVMRVSHHVLIYIKPPGSEPVPKNRRACPSRPPDTPCVATPTRWLLSEHRCGLHEWRISQKLALANDIANCFTCKENNNSETFQMI